MNYFEYKEFDSPDLPNSGKLYMDEQFMELLDHARAIAGILFYQVYLTQALTGLELELLSFTWTARIVKIPMLSGHTNTVGSTLCLKNSKIQMLENSY